ncbi:MAG: hypothetical protein OK457_10185, partial [Thaumarchaeota archaeon]|nr:hypothetical protein [Nitrososphaerota archaeon]
MKSKNLRFLCGKIILFIFLLSIFAGWANNQAIRTSAQVSPTTSSEPSFIEIGFGPDTLSLASLGTPIFTTNDSLWIHSLSSDAISVTMIDPSGIVSYGPAILSSSTASAIHFFTNSDPQGIWNLSVRLPNSSTYSIPITFQVPAVNNSIVSLTEYSIQYGQINLGFAADSVSAYDLEACLTSNFGNGT